MPDWKQLQLQWVNNAIMAMPTMYSLHNNAAMGNSTQTNTWMNKVKSMYWNSLLVGTATNYTAITKLDKQILLKTQSGKSPMR